MKRLLLDLSDSHIRVTVRIRIKKESDQTRQRLSFKLLGSLYTSNKSISVIHVFVTGNFPLLLI